MRVLSKGFAMSGFLMAWLIFLGGVSLTEAGDTSIVLHEWTEYLSVDGRTLHVTGRQMFDSTSGSEYTEYFNEQGVRLPAVLIEQYQKEWDGLSACSVPATIRPDDGQTLKKRKVDVCYPDQPGPCIVLPVLSPEAIPAAEVDLMKDGVLIGLRRNLPSAVDFNDGLLLPDGRGGLVWKLSILAEEAKGIRVHLDNAYFPAGCSFLVYDSENPIQVV